VPTWLTKIIISRTEWFEMTPSQAEMMYSYCKDSAVPDRVHYVKSKATLYNKTFR
jgi:hypothetical protein